MSKLKPKQELIAGVSASSHLSPFIQEDSDNFEMPMRIGCTIAAWDKPKFVEASQAPHMRDEDYVVGLIHKGVYRAYPMWVTDHYHAINDRIAGDRVLFTTCERCQSGAAYHAQINGENIKFSGMGK